jgi:sugar phosphate isomerase/epimerase
VGELIEYIIVGKRRVDPSAVNPEHVVGPTSSIASIPIRCAAMNADIGICPATLLVDPMQADPSEVAAAGDAATAAGFTDASVWAFQLDGLADVGLHPHVLEAALAWAGDDPVAAAAEAEQFAALVAAHGSKLVAAVALAPTIADLDGARQQLDALARRVAHEGARVCVEFFAWSAITDLRLAWELVEPLPEVGLIVDTFHWHRQRGGPNVPLLASIPGDRIFYVQIADAAAEPTGDAETEAMTARLLPGDGVVDFAQFFAVLDDIGADPFLATEIFNPSLAAELGAERAAAAMRDTARSVLS